MNPKWTTLACALILAAVALPGLAAPGLGAGQPCVTTQPANPPPSSPREYVQGPSSPSPGAISTRAYVPGLNVWVVETTPCDVLADQVYCMVLRDLPATLPPECGPLMAMVEDMVYDGTQVVRYGVPPESVVMCVFMQSWYGVGPWDCVGSPLPKPTLPPGPGGP